MRTLQLPPFPHKVEIPDFEHYYRTRLSQKPERSAEWGIPLLAHMAWPNQAQEREQVVALLTDSRLPDFSTKYPAWVRVSDILHLHYDLEKNERQQSRGGASIGKAIFLASKIGKARGTGQATLWDAWGQYRDAAHLIAATMLVCGDLQQRRKTGAVKLDPQQILPVRVALIMPELILAVAQTYQHYGLNYIPVARSEPMFNPDTILRISSEINVVAIEPPVRQIRTQDIITLNQRRAGNRGRRNESNPDLVPASALETTPIP